MGETPNIERDNVCYCKGNMERDNVCYCKGN